MIDYTLIVWNGNHFTEFIKVDRHYMKDGALHIFHSNSKRSFVVDVIIPAHAFTSAMVQED